MGKIGLEEEERVAFIPLGAKSPLSFTLLNNQLRLIQDLIFEFLINHRLPRSQAGRIRIFVLTHSNMENTRNNHKSKYYNDDPGLVENP